MDAINEIKITEITRKNIFDELCIQNIQWNGRLGEIDFLNRIFNLKERRSDDPRFPDMEGDVWQHRVNNYDWEDDWVFGDIRLNLLRCDDQTFLKFLCEMIHPIVRSDEGQIKTLLGIFNENLKNDGFKVVIQKYTSGKPVFHAIHLDGFSVPFENIEKVGRTFIKEQMEKCDRKLSEGDFDGAITNARSLLESVICDVYKKMKGEEMQSKGDLIKDYKEIKELLHLVESDAVSNSLNQITSGLTSVVNGLASVSNKMSDRHNRKIEPERHHTKLIINSVKVVIDFLYDQYSILEQNPAYKVLDQEEVV